MGRGKPPSPPCSFFFFAMPALMLLFTLILTIALPVQGTSSREAAPKCQVFEKLPVECVPYVTYRVFVRANSSQQQVAEAMQPLLETASKLQSQTCKETWTAFLCGVAFPKCSYADESKTMTLMHPICYAVCTGVLQDCRGEFQLAQMEQNLPNCNETTSNGLPKYPDESHPYEMPTGPNTTVSYKCFTPGVRDGDDIKSSAKCPKHYVDLGDEFDDSLYVTPCQRECPLATYSDSEYNALSITQIVLGYMGFVMLILVLIPYLINFSETNTFPQTIPLYIYISCGLMALGFMWPSFFDGFRNVTCEKNSRTADTTYFPCAVQGTLLYWGTCTLAMWWFNTCIHILIGAFAGIGYQNKILRIIYYFCGWILPTAGLITGWFSAQIGSSSTSVNCFIDMDAGGGWWANGLFYLELTIIVCIGFLAMHIAILQLLRKHGFSGFHKQGRLMIFAYSFLCIFLFIMIYWWVIEARRSHYEHATDHWFDCLIKRFIEEEKAGHSIYNSSEDYGCILADRNPYGMIYTQMLILSSMPLLISIIFGHSWYTWNMWGTIVCSFLCVAIHSIANPSSLFSLAADPSSLSPRRSHKGKNQHKGWHSGSGDIEMEGIGSHVSFAVLGSDDEAEEWAGDSKAQAVEEGELGGKGRKRTSASAVDADSDASEDDDRSDGEASEYTDEDSDKEE